MQETAEVDKRNRQNESSSKKKQQSQSSFFNFKNFDLYTKVDDDFKVQTSWGALLSIFGWVVIFILIAGQINVYMTPKYKEHMIVDSSLGHQLIINVNISFHSLTCNEVHLDTMDVAGDNQLNIEQNMIKQRISVDGKIHGDPLIVTKRPDNKVKEDPTLCYPCYGAETDKRKCCNTCDELKAAYKERGWNTADIVQSAKQCVDYNNQTKIEMPHGEGCRVVGTMRVNKVAGNFHIAHGESIVRDGHHIHQFIPAEAPKFNVSHTIHSLSFGHTYPGMKQNPLDLVTKVCGEDTGTGLYQYFIKVIPTIYHGDYGGKMFSNQYTYSSKFRALNYTLGSTTAPGVLPGIFFVYEMSPFSIDVEMERVPFSHLVTKLFAIVGGVYTVLGVIDSLLFTIQKALKL